MHVDLRRLGAATAFAAVGLVGFGMLRDDARLDARAAELACRGHVCNAVQKKKSRDLFGWTFTFATYAEQTLSVDVTCTRELWVVGEYRCDVSEIDHAGDGRFEQREQKPAGRF